MATIPEKPQTNLEQYLNRIATGDGEYPAKPRTNVEQYLDYIIENGIGRGGEAKVVDKLPEEGETGYIYLVLKESTGEGDIYDEWIWVLQQDGETYGWEHLGATNEVKIQLYDEIGLNTDGAMTQRATTAMKGKARVLTADDYNWPENNPNGVALWKMGAGCYVPGRSVCVYFNWGTGVRESNALYLVGNTMGDRCPILRILDTPGESHFYNTDTGSGNGFVYRPFVTVEDNLTSVNAKTALSAKQGKILNDKIEGRIITGAGAPTTSTVGTVGQIYVDTTNGNLYICTDASNPYVWEEVSGKPTVVQTTGTSTTDVMSQNAVTGMVFADLTQQAIRIGSSATPGGQGSVSIGRNASATSSGAGALAIGNNASARSWFAMAVGSGAIADNRGVALGTSAKAEGDYSVAMGCGARATQKGEMNIGVRESEGYNNSNYRLLTGLYDPQSAHDAANKQYVDTAVAGAGAAEINSTDWSDLWQ